METSEIPEKNGWETTGEIPQKNDMETSEIPEKNDRETIGAWRRTGEGRRHQPREG
jgi:hypothetical protein